MAQQSYRQVLELYDRAKAFGETKTLPEYAKHLNDIYQTQDYSEGIRDGWWTRASTRADQYLGDTLGQITGPIGEGVGSIFGQGEAGRHVGEGLPRAILQSLPLYLAGPEAGIPATVAALGGTGLAFGAQTYADTGSPKAALISGVAAAAMPPIGGAVGGLGAKLAGGSRVAGELAGGGAFNRILGSSVAGNVGRVEASRFAGSQLGQFGANELSAYMQQKTLDPTASFDPFSAEMLLSQIPFTVYDSVHAATAPKLTKESVQPLMRPKVEPVKQEFVPAAGSDEAAAQVGAMNARLAAIRADPTMGPEAETAALKELFESVLNPEQVQKIKAVQKMVQPDEPTITLKGQADPLGNGNYRVLVEGHNNIEHGPAVGSTVFVNGVQPEADGTFQVKPSQMKATKYALPPKNVVDPLQPELPVQESGDPNAAFGGAPQYTPADAAGLADMGISPEQAATVHPSEVTIVKQIVAQHELTQQVAEEAKGKIAAVPTKAEEWADLVKPKETTWLEDALAERRAQGWDDKWPFVPADLQNASFVEAIKNDPGISNEERQKILKFANVAYGKLPINEAAVKVQNGATPTQAVESARLATQTPTLDAAIQQQHILEDAVKELTSSIQTEYQGRPVKSRGRSLVNAEGRRYYFKSESEAQEFLDNYKRENPTDEVPWAVSTGQDRGKGKYYLGVMAGEGKSVVAGTSLDAPRTEGGGTLHEAITKETPQMREEGDVSEIAEELHPQRPSIAAGEIVKNLDLAEKSLVVFSNHTGLDVDESRLVIQQAKAVLPEVMAGKVKDVEAANTLLKSKGIPEFEDKAEMQRSLRLARDGADAFDGKKAFDLESQIPHDQALVDEIGIQQSLTKALSWWSSLPETGVMGTLVKDLLRALPALDSSVDVQLPGMLGHDPKVGWLFKMKANVRPDINVRYLPYNKEDAFIWGLKLAHETAHYATRELSRRTDPAALEFKATVDTARETLTNSKVLPKKVRELIVRSNKEDHVGKYARGEWSYDDLVSEWRKSLGKDTSDWWEVTYGLSNRDELIAQLFGSPEMVALARNTKMPKGIVLTVLDYFSESWGKLFGRLNIKDNALAQLLNKLDDYLVPLNYVESYNGRQYIRDSLVGTQGVRDVALASRIKTVEDIVNKGDLFHSVLGFQREGDAGQLPVTAAYDVINTKLRTSLLMGAPQDVHRSTMGLLVDEIPTAQELWHRMSEDVNLAKQTIAEVKQGRLTGTVNKDAEANLRLSAAKIDTMRKALDKQANALQRMEAMQTLSPEGWESALARQLFEGKKAALTEDSPEASSLRAKMALERLEGGGKMSWLAKTFGLTQHVKEMYPSAKPVIGRVADEQGQAHARAALLNLAFAWDPTIPDAHGRSGSVSKDIIRAVDRVRSSESLSTAASDLFRYQNKEGKAKELSLADPFVRDTLSRFNEKDRKDIIQAITSNQNRQKTWANVVLPEAMGRQNVAYTAQLIGARESGMMPETARDLSTQLYSGLGKIVDPTTAAIGAQELSVLQTKMSPDTYLKSLQHAQQLSQKTAAWIQQLKDRPGYVSEQRYGSDQLVMVGPKGEKFRTSGDREKLAAIQKSKASEGYTLLDYVAAEDASAPRMGIREDMLRGLEELDNQNSQLMTQLLGDKPDILAKVLPGMQRAQDLRDSLAAAGPLPKVQRKFVAGREYINMLDNADQFYVRMNNWLRNRLTRAETQVDMSHPEVESNPELRKFLQQHVDNFLTADNPTARKIVEATYFYKLAFDVGNSMLEATQNLTTGMSSLIGETGSVGEAFDRWGKAVATIAKYHKNGGKWDTAEHHWAMERAKELGLGGIASWSDIVDPDSTAVFDANAGKVGGALGMLKSTARGWTTKVSRYNDWIGLLAGFDMARERGMEMSDALAFANDVRVRGTFNGGKAQRPVGLWSIKTRPVPQLLGALQNYTLGWFGQMAEHWQKGFGKAPAGLTDTQRSGAKKAFFYSLAAQAALAGALGLPGVGQGIALLNQATGLDLKGKLIQNLNELFQEDQATGGTLTSLAMRGIGAYGLPFDPSSRASISVPFLGVDSYKGFSVANLGGAATSTVGDFVEGLMGLARGDMSAADKLLPNAAKRPFQLGLEGIGEGVVRDSRGTMLLGKESALSPAERFLTAAGLQPSRVQAARDTSEAVKKANLVAQRQKETFVDSVATLLRGGKTQEAQLQLMQYLKEHPEENYKSLAQSVAGRVEAQSVPYDWRRDVNPGADLAGFSSVNPSTELLRRQVREGVSQSLGVVSRSNPRADYLAQQLDWLMDSGMSKAEANKQVRPRRYQQPGPSGWQ